MSEDILVTIVNVGMALTGVFLVMFSILMALVKCGKEEDIKENSDKDGK